MCDTYCAPKPVNSDNVSHGTKEPMDDGLNKSRDAPLVPPGLPSTSHSSWQPYLDANASKGSWVCRRNEKQSNGLTAGMPLVIEPLDVPAPSERYVQHRIAPKRLLLPHSDDEILSGIDDDVSSIRNGCTAWWISHPPTTLERHMVSKGGAKPIYRDAHDRRHFSPSQHIVSTTTCHTVTRADTSKHPELESWTPRKPLPTYQFRLAPHLCGGQDACQVSGLMYVGS